MTVIVNGLVALGGTGLGIATTPSIPGMCEDSARGRVECARTP